MTNETQREIDLAYCLDGEAITATELFRLQKVWDRAYQMGIWRGIDLTAVRVQAALNLAANDAARP